MKITSNVVVLVAAGSFSFCLSLGASGTSFASSPPITQSGAMHLSEHLHLAVGVMPREEDEDAAEMIEEPEVMLPPATAEDGRGYPVSALDFKYVHNLMELPSAGFIKEWEVELGMVADGYVAPRAGVPLERIALGRIGRDREVNLYTTAAQLIVEELRTEIQNLIQADVFVALNDEHVDPLTGHDLRTGRNRSLGFKIEYTGPTRLIDGFELMYLRPDVGGQPGIRELLNVEVSLVPTAEHGYVAWRPGMTPVSMTIGEINQMRTQRFADSGLQEVLVAVRDALTDRGLMAVRTVTNPVVQEAALEANDDPQYMPIVIVTGVVNEIRTLASGDRFRDPDDRLNNPRHRRILERSPVQPGDVNRQLLLREELDNYIYRLGRHPGRRVDVAIAPGQPEQVEIREAGEVRVATVPTISLDYIVTENKPLLFYVQGSNTGTSNTGRWRQRFGLFHNQLTNNDDILNIDYNTASFSDSHAVTGSYEAPFFDSERVRWRLNGMWNEFDASEVGFARLRFTGESWSIGGELAFNVYQDRQFFLDLVGGARYLDVEVENFFFGIPIVQGSQDFVIPYGGVRLERVTEESMLRAAVMFEANIADATDVDRAQMNALGRLFPDRSWQLIRWDSSFSFFLEPLLNREAWEDIGTPESSTLAHEIALSFRGQYAFDNRLIPQMSSVAGGMFTVRGYPESIVAGDTVLMGTAEYRFHLPRAFAPQEEVGDLLGQPFRYAPQQLYGRADWDLTFRGFVDFARVINHNKLSFESDHTLIGTGVGVEFQLLRNLNVRVDWGFALKGIEGRVSSGSERVHFAGTLLF